MKVYYIKRYSYYICYYLWSMYVEKLMIPGLVIFINLKFDVKNV